MQRWVDVIEEVPNMTDHHAADLVLGHNSMHNKAERHQHPREIGSCEDQQSQKAEAGIRVATAPDVDQTGGKRSAQKWERKERRDDQEGDHCVE